MGSDWFSKKAKKTGIESNARSQPIVILLSEQGFYTPPRLKPNIQCRNLDIPPEATSEGLECRPRRVAINSDTNNIARLISLPLGSIRVIQVNIQ